MVKQKDKRFPVCVALIKFTGSQVGWKEEVKGQRLVEHRENKFKTECKKKR